MKAGAKLYEFGQHDAYVITIDRAKGRSRAPRRSRPGWARPSAPCARSPIVAKPGPAAASAPVELGLALLDERLDALVEVVGLLQESVGKPFQLEPDMERAVVDRVEHALRHRE